MSLAQKIEKAIQEAHNLSHDRGGVWRVWLDSPYVYVRWGGLDGEHVDQEAKRCEWTEVASVNQGGVTRLKCAGCGEHWPCSDLERRDISGIERAKHHL